MRKFPPVAALVALGAAAGAVITWWPHVRNEFFVVLGNRDEAGGWYGFHSGFGGSWIPQYAGLVLLVWWHSQCHVTGCFWPARRLTAANERACWRHHPHPRRTAADLNEEHHAILRRRA